MSENDNGNGKPRRPWFGSMRVGYGLSPKTWQGWVVVIVAVVVLIVLARLIVHK
jgi:hypothetical protein